MALAAALDRPRSSSCLWIFQLGRSLACVGVGAWCDRGLSAPSFYSVLSLFSLAARWARWWRELAAVAALRDWKPAAAHVTGKIVVAWTGRGTALVSCDLHEPGAFRLPTPILLFACAMAMAGRGGLFVYCCRATGWAETVRSQLHRALGGHYTRALWLSSLVHLPILLPFLSRSALLQSSDLSSSMDRLSVGGMGGGV